MRDLAFFAVWIVLFPISFWSPQIGVMLWVWTALIAPNTLLYGPMSGVPYGKLVAVITTLTLIFSKERKQFYIDACLGLCALFLALITVSTLINDGSSGADWDLYFKIVKIGVFVLIFSAVITTRRRMHFAVIAVCLGFGFDATWEGSLFLATAGSHHNEGKSSLGDNNHVAVAFIMLLPLLIYVSRWSAMRASRIIFGAVAFLDVLGVLATNSRGGFVGLLAAGLVFISGTKNKLSSLFAAGCIVGVIAATAPASFYDRMQTIDAADQDSSFMGRVIAWKMSTLIALDQPLTGGGLHAVQKVSVWSRFTQEFDRLDFIPTDQPDTIPHAAHSIWFEVLGDTGFVGLALFASILATLLIYCIHVQRMTRKDPELAWANNLAFMLQVSLVGYVVAGSAVSMGYEEMPYIFAAMISRMRQIVLETRRLNPAFSRNALRQPAPAGLVSAGVARTSPS